MESGFVELNDATSLQLGKDEKLFLFRIPKEMDTKLLNGIHLDITQKHNVAVIETQNRTKYTLSKETSNFSDNVRPVLKDSVTSSARVGDKFDGCINISMSFDLPSPDESKKRSYSKAYGHVQQLDFLQVRSMPRGSLSTVAELKNRQKESAKELKAYLKVQRSQLEGSSRSSGSGNTPDTSYSVEKTPKKLKSVASLVATTLSEKKDDSILVTTDKKKKKKKDKTRD